MAFKFRGDILITRLANVLRLNTDLTRKTITGAETLTAVSTGWQSLSAAATQDVNLPDATAANMKDGWKVIIEASGAASLTVKNSGGTTLQTITAADAYEFVLKDNGTANGVWFITKLGVSSATEARHVATFNATGDWGSASGGVYTYTLTAATHAVGTRPLFKIYETVGANDVAVEVHESRFVTASGNIEIDVLETPDDRFAGKIVVE